MVKEKKPGKKRVVKDAVASDAFQNAMARLGFGMPSLTGGASYPLTRLSRDYNLMNSLYRSNWDCAQGDRHHSRRRAQELDRTSL